ncbi:MAG: CRISPR-associated endonuclease Cas1 [Methanolinea sp.]|nr:CRISPR-associated endonuclease Cas1 [Methanolinea sp.]
MQKNGKSEEIPLSRVRHLLVMGGHSIHSSVFSRLLASGSCISFFEADGEPLGIAKPFGFRYDELVREAQMKAFSHSFALAMAKGSLHSRILTLVRLQEERGEALFYEGELEILEKSYAELDYLVRVEEIRRIHRLVSDMYYEILARTLPPELEFRRRTPRPHMDVVNTMLSFGYGLLFGNTCVAAIGAHLDPDTGFLHKGKGALVYDLIDPFKAGMVDGAISSLARAGIPPEEYECGPARCILTDDLLQVLTRKLHESIRQELIDQQVMSLQDALLKKADYLVRA